MTVPSDEKRTTLSSTIRTVIEEKSSDNIQSTGTNSINQSNDTTEDNNSNSEKKRKKHCHHHHKKHRRHHSKSPNSKSKRCHHIKDNDTRTIVEDTTTNSAPVIEAQ
jgi:hypothetical protein